MEADPRDHLTVLLDAVRAGHEGAPDRLVRAIYGELKRIARGLMNHERPGHTLQPSALVHEALLRLLEGDALADLPDRHHFFTAAARAMRQVLVDHARRRGAAKRGPGRARLPLDEALAAIEDKGLDVIDLHEALDHLAGTHPRPAQVVDLRYFGGLTVPEVAEMLGVSEATVKNDWRFARAWLRDRLGGTLA
ncbi:MAG TPA: sigma-70 family RNA polymerase sigma factor [Isosphaeraceae bacterium]|nr:sigma-70 family RNA polymerase sigma factor [Isosphaeraceae bacterium]